MSTQSLGAEVMTRRQGTDFGWFKFVMPELYEKYGHCYAVISDRRVLGTYQSFGEAVGYAVDKVGYGNFIVREVGDSADAYTATFSHVWVTA